MTSHQDRSSEKNPVGLLGRTGSVSWVRGEGGEYQWSVSTVSDYLGDEWRGRGEGGSGEGGS